MKLVRDWYYLDRWVATDHPAERRHCGRSLVWICHKCGTIYARMKCQVEETIQTYHPVMGCCPHCPGNRYGIPGSFEALFLLGQQLPREILEIQLTNELAFLNDSSHPHNDGETQC